MLFQHTLLIPNNHIIDLFFYKKKIPKDILVNPLTYYKETRVCIGNIVHHNNYF